MAIAKLNGQEIQKVPNHECLRPQKFGGLEQLKLDGNWLKGNLGLFN
jgi:hypothetical protein